MRDATPTHPRHQTEPGAPAGWESIPAGGEDLTHAAPVPHDPDAEPTPLGFEVAATLSVSIKNLTTGEVTTTHDWATTSGNSRLASQHAGSAIRAVVQTARDRIDLMAYNGR